MLDVVRDVWTVAGLAPPLLAEVVDVEEEPAVVARHGRLAAEAADEDDNDEGGAFE